MGRFKGGVTRWGLFLRRGVFEMCSLFPFTVLVVFSLTLCSLFCANNSRGPGMVFWEGGFIRGIILFR